jgi:hypothetical protein
MRSRTTVAKETQRAVGGGGATTTQQKQQKTRINKCAAAEVEDVCGGRGRGQQRLARGRVQWWRQRSNCCMAAEEKQHHGGWSGGRKWAGRHGAGYSYFSFLGGVESYLQSYPLQSYQKCGVTFGIWGGDFCYD